MNREAAVTNSVARHNDFLIVRPHIRHDTNIPVTGSDVVHNHLGLADAQVTVAPADTLLPPSLAAADPLDVHLIGVDEGLDGGPPAESSVLQVAVEPEAGVFTTSAPQ